MPGKGLEFVPKVSFIISNWTISFLENNNSRWFSPKIRLNKKTPLFNKWGCIIPFTAYFPILASQFS
jgi:hypothetical protein